MKTIWILPHREQGDDEDVVCDGVPDKLSDVLDVSSLPPSLVLGIPESVLRKHGGSDLLFSQFIRHAGGDKAYFLLSMPAGTDRSERAVYLSCLQVLGNPEAPIATPDTEVLSKADRHLADGMVDRLSGGIDRWASSVHTMLRAVQTQPDTASFANVEIPNTPYPVNWSPEKRKTRSAASGLALSVVLVGVTALLLRNCSGQSDTNLSPPAAAQAGAGQPLAED